jgi:hypothetical protein
LRSTAIGKSDYCKRKAPGESPGLAVLTVFAVNQCRTMTCPAQSNL